MTDKRWPVDWASRVQGTTCEMCEKQPLVDNGYGLRIREGTHGDAFLQRAALVPGYTIVIWKHGHAVEMTSLNPQQLQGYWTDVVETARALTNHLRPIKMNYVTLGNVVPHLHTHLLPRFVDDPAAGGPIPMNTSGLPPWPESEFLLQVAALRNLMLPRTPGEELPGTS
jgi:diadenosine tetraphosphate (Ap4A) HIT family hydrolase